MLRFPPDLSLKEGTLIGTIKKWGKEFVVRFEVIIKEYGDKNIIHFTTGSLDGDGEMFGNACPSLYTNQRRLYVITGLNDNPKYRYDDPDGIGQNTWTKIEVTYFIFLYWASIIHGQFGAFLV